MLKKLSIGLLITFIIQKLFFREKKAVDKNIYIDNNSSDEYVEVDIPINNNIDYTHPNQRNDDAVFRSPD